MPDIVCSRFGARCDDTRCWMLDAGCVVDSGISASNRIAPVFDRRLLRSAGSSRTGLRPRESGGNLSNFFKETLDETTGPYILRDLRFLC